MYITTPIPRQLSFSYGWKFAFCPAVGWLTPRGCVGIGFAKSSIPLLRGNARLGRVIRHYAADLNLIALDHYCGGQYRAKSQAVCDMFATVCASPLARRRTVRRSSAEGLHPIPTALLRPAAGIMVRNGWNHLFKLVPQQLDGSGWN